jgi:site-specific recombinase XerD
MRLSALFEEFTQFLRVEKGTTAATIATYRWCFGDFLAFVMTLVGGTVLLAHFTEETCRSYQYDLAGRELKSGTIRVRVATLGSFGKWMVRRDKLVRNPVDRRTWPRRCYGYLVSGSARCLPSWPMEGFVAVKWRRWTWEMLPLPSGFDGSWVRVVTRCRWPCRLLRGPSCVTTWPPSGPACLPATAPLFVVMYENRAGQRIERRITGQRIWKLAKAVGARAGLGALHPHALRHACGAELLRRTKNLRVVQEQLRHVDIQTTTGSTRLTQQDVRQALETLGDEGE